jgi:hypothetical protein
MSEQSKPTIFAPSQGCDVPEAGFASDRIAARIAAFLDGRTCGEELLHALYDYVLDEPIPQSMRALLSK